MRTGTNWRMPARAVHLSVTTIASGAGRRRWPSAASSGRTMTCRLVCTAPGLPGSAATGTPSITPKPCGLAGWMPTEEKFTPRALSTCRATSWAPTEAPPVVRSRSTSPAVRVTMRSNSSGSSLLVWARVNPPPNCVMPAPMSRELESSTWPGPGFSATTSSPVTITPTRTCGHTFTREMPTPASAARAAPSSRVPSVRISSPALTSEPATRTLRSAGQSPGTRTASGSGARVLGWSVNSTGITVFAPAGSGAPVMIRTAVPATQVPEPPAGISADTGRVTSPAPGRSAVLTANPSIAELVNPGAGSCAFTASASRRPAAAASGRLTAASGRTRWSTESRYSSNLRIPLGAPVELTAGLVALRRESGFDLRREILKQLGGLGRRVTRKGCPEGDPHDVRADRRHGAVVPVGDVLRQVMHERHIHERRLDPRLGRYLVDPGGPFLAGQVRPTFCSHSPKSSQVSISRVLVGGTATCSQFNSEYSLRIEQLTTPPG